MFLILSNALVMHKILLFCEIFIAIFGVYAVIIADNTHERLHGLFVVGLALEGFLSIEFPGHTFTFTVMIVLTLIAALMIIMSFHSLVEHVKRYLHRMKKPDVVPHSPSLEISVDKADTKEITELINDRFERMEKILSEREKVLCEREMKLSEREKVLEEKFAVYTETQDLMSETE